MRKVVIFFKRTWKGMMLLLLLLFLILLLLSLLVIEKKINERDFYIGDLESVIAMYEEDAGLNNGSESSGLLALDEEVQRQKEAIEEVASENDAQASEIAELQRRLNLLEKEGKTETVEADSDSVSVSEDSVEEYLNIKFPFDGNYYRDTEGILFYTDPTCTKQINDVRLMSKEYDDEKAENGLSIYCWRMSDGNFCYSTGFPNLVTEAEYEQILSEQK